MMLPRRAILQVLWGREAGRKVVVDPGGSVRVGRLPPSDLTVPLDTAMSAEHFSLTWDGARGVLRDLGSASGTLLCGKAVAEGAVAHASSIHAGNTVFLLCAEGAVPPQRRRAPAEIATRKEKEEARAALRAVDAPLFAVLDAARDLRILELLRQSPEEHHSLYDGARGDALADVAPYLVPLPAGGALRDQLVDEGWGQSWGVFLTSHAAFADVRRSLRRVLMVEIERAGQRDARAYFRFYDPRVLRTFWPASTLRQRSELLIELEAFIVEGERGEVLRFTRP